MCVCVCVCVCVSVCVCVCVCECVCVHAPPRLLMTSGVMWHDTGLCDWLNNFYIAAVVGIISKHGLRIDIYMS